MTECMGFGCTNEAVKIITIDISLPIGNKSVKEIWLCCENCAIWIQRKAVANLN